jgi:N-acetylglucosaminyl-diphospho-decaprenol L-rhamnosyltransferase
MADVTITIVLYNSADTLEPCLASLTPDLVDGGAELVVVDNASPDDSSALVRRLVPAARVVESAENRGFAGGCNLAWPYVESRYWLLLNPDTIVEADTVARLVAFMDQNARVAAASPWLRDPATGEWKFPGRAFPSAGRALLELSRAHRLLPAEARARLLQGPYVKRAAGPAPAPDWLPGTALLVRTQAVREIGLLDESFFLYGEDLEWCWRMRSVGWRLAVVDTVVSHHARTSGERTWSEQAVETRIADGIVRATRRMRGPLRARATALVSALGLALESWHPGRSREQRANAARARDAWWLAFRRA